MIGKPSFSEWVLKPNRYSKATFEVIGVRFIPRWWRRGESNPRPKTLPWELLRAQPVIAEVLLLPFPSPQASRHA